MNKFLQLVDKRVIVSSAIGTLVAGGTLALAIKSGIKPLKAAAKSVK